MHISEELQRVKTILRRPEPETKHQFVSLLEPMIEKPPGPKAKEDLCRFDLLAFRKSNLPPFKASGSHKMFFTTKNVSWVHDDIDSLNELLRQFLKNRPDFRMAILYDNILPSELREDRWIFKYEKGFRTVNRLYEYDAVVKEKYLKEIESLPEKK